ncbi:MAG TPA: lysophospholipid acyltransferase family protein [Candidatus Binataceae bacterium]|nr:lysophospholipid acyltransferase family protein [Candidatus Binataceae bacterium]
MPRQIGKFHASVEYAPIAAFVRLMAKMPLERAVRLGARMGGTVMRLDIMNRPIAMRNLSIAFPDLTSAARLKILRAMYRSWGRMFAEFAHSHELDRSNIEQFVTYDGFENLEVAQNVAGRRGLLVLTAHFGNWELLPLAHSIYGNRIAIVHRPLRNPLVDLAVREARMRFGNEVIERKNSGPLILKYIRDKWQVAVALDLDVRDGVFVDFFGMPACTSDGVARIAMATGAPVLPAFMVRDGHSLHHRITILPHLEMVKTRDREECVRENTQRMTAAIEAAIRKHPDHWNWIHRRWKTRPPGEARFY